MEHGCEHEDSSPIGTCAICGRSVCADCYQEIFSTMICDQHKDMEDEGMWELLGFYSDSAALADRRFILEDHGINSLVVETEDDTTELYVPGEEKADAFAVLSGAGADSYMCDDCSVYYSREAGVCPICGVRPVDTVDESN